MRILHVITNLEMGGAETALVKLAVHQAALGHAVGVVALKEVGDVAGPLERARVPVTALHAPQAPGPGTVWAVAGLSAYLKTHTFDVVHAWLAQACVAVTSVLPPSMPRVMALRVTDVPSRLWCTVLRANPIHRTAWLAVGHAVADAWAPALGLTPSELMVAPNGVDVDPVVQKEPTGARAVFVGRLGHQKGVDVLLRAVLEGALCVDVYGAGPDGAMLRATAEAMGLRSRVVFHGSTRNARDVMRQASMVILPSRSEGMPNVVLEAMAVGRAVVATDIPGTREVVVAGETGLLVPPDDAWALHEAMESLDGNKVLRTRLGKAGHHRAAEVFSNARMMEATMAAYARVVG